MGANSKLITISHLDDLDKEWLDYDEKYYNFDKSDDINDVVYCELIYCETTDKSRDLMDCFNQIRGFSDFQNHLILTKNLIDWGSVKYFDKQYSNSNLKEKLTKLVGSNNIVMFIPDF